MKNAPADRQGFLTGKRPVLRFVGLFALFMAIFYAITATRWFRHDFFPAYLELNSRAAAVTLRLLGESDAQSAGAIVFSSKYALEVKRGCDGLEPLMLFAAAILAFAAPWRAKLAGIGLGFACLVILNLLRIVSLYYTGVHFPRAFEIVHVDVWQVAFVGFAMLFWIAWAWRVGGGSIAARSGSNGKAQTDARP